MKVMGVKESKGTYEGYDYYNFKLHCLEPIEPTKGQGHECVVVKVPHLVFSDFVQRAAGGNISKVLGLEVDVIYDRYGKVTRVSAVK